MTSRSNFFRASHINEYKNLLKPTFAERNLTLLNLEDLLQYLQTTRLDIVSYGLRKSAVREHRKVQEREQNISSIIHDLAARICSNIGKEYGKVAVEKTIKTTSDMSRFDILVLIDADYEILDTKSKKSLMDQRFDKIRGFLVSELGECKTQPLAHTVNLICATIAGGGAFLMGAYLYCIKRTPQLPQIGLLELAGGYTNGAGLCAYSKFGYVPNIAYLTPECFGDSHNLPMSVSVAHLTVEQILAVVRGESKITQFNPFAREKTIFDMLYTHPLCSRELFRNETEQKDLARDYNNLYRFMYDVRTLTDYEADAGYIPNPVMDMIQRELQKKVDFYANKKAKTGKYLSENEKTAVVRDIVNEELNRNIDDLTYYVNKIQKKKTELLERRKQALIKDIDTTHDKEDRRILFENIRNLDEQIGAINLFKGDDTPSPENVHSVVSLTPSPASSVMSVESEDDATGKTPYNKKIYAKQLAKATAKKLASKRATLKKLKNSTKRQPPKVPRKRTVPPPPGFSALP